MNVFSKIIKFFFPSKEVLNESQIVEKDFLQSWTEMEMFFQRIAHRPEGKKLLAFIKDLRALGYDKKLRAGQSLFVFILSRARHHGLDGKQKHTTIGVFPTHAEIKNDGIVKHIDIDNFVVNNESLVLIDKLLLEAIN